MTKSITANNELKVLSQILSELKELRTKISVLISTNLNVNGSQLNFFQEDFSYERLKQIPISVPIFLEQEQVVLERQEYSLLNDSILFAISMQKDIEIEMTKQKFNQTVICVSGSLKSVQGKLQYNFEKSLNLEAGIPHKIKANEQSTFILLCTPMKR